MRDQRLTPLPKAPTAARTREFRHSRGRDAVERRVSSAALLTLAEPAFIRVPNVGIIAA